MLCSFQIAYLASSFFFFSPFYLSIFSLSLYIQLLELFDQIDANGDGKVVWEEFSDFCIAAGMMSKKIT
jgi:hypothetical protein